MGDNTITESGGDVPALDEDVLAEMAALGLEAEEQSPEEITQAAALASNSEQEYRELLTQLMGPAFAVMAPGWGIASSEVDALAAAYSPLLVKYFPEGPEKFGPEISAALVTVMVIAPRLSMPRKLEKAPEKPKQKGQKSPMTRESEVPQVAAGAAPAQPGGFDNFDDDIEVSADALGAVA